MLVDVSNYAAPLVKNSISATNATEITSDGTTIYLLDNAKNTQKLQILSSDPFATDKKPFEMQRENPNFQGKGENADNVKGSQTHDSIWGGSGNDTLKGASGNDSIDGHNGDDKLFGEDDNDLLLGGNGNDVLNGGDGDDTLQGGAGNDTLDGSNGADQMEGGEGDDYYVVDNLGDVIIEDSSSKGGIDTVEISVQIPRAFIGVENYLIKSERDINVAGDDNPNQITGGSGNNYLRGNGGNDTLIGGSGDDTLEGGKNIDRLDGGAGNDTYIIENDEDFIIDTQGENQVQSSKTISITTYDAIKNLELTGNAAVDGTGNDKNNFIEGNENNNKLDGRKGNDTIYAGGGDDTLIGGSGGNDFLDGGNGEDLVRYDKPQSDFDPKFIDGVYVVTHIQSGNKDELHNVEYLQFADSALIPIQSTSQKTLKFSVVDAFTQEGKEAILTLKLDSPAEEDVKINVQTVDSTAKKGVDYEKSSEVVIFSASQTTKTLKIKTTQNQLVEDDKKFMVNFSSDDENVQIQTPTAFVTIEDDDKPKISIASAKITEGQAGKSLVDVTVSLSAPAKQTVKVLCETSDGTAKNSTDYEAIRKTLEILAGKKTAKFSVPIVDDKISESLESFFVNLSNPQNATIDPKKSVATVEIIDNDSNTSAALQIALVGSQNIIDVTQ